MISVNVGAILPQSTVKPNKNPKDMNQHYMPMIHKL